LGAGLLVLSAFMLIALMNSGVRVWRWRLCKNCTSYNQTRTFRDGWHELTLRATFKNSIETLKVSFLVATGDFVIS